MSVFTEAEIGYLESNTMGRLATIGADGGPHLVPLTYRFNADEDAIDIGASTSVIPRRGGTSCRIRGLYSWWTTLPRLVLMPSRFEAMPTRISVAES
jgi:Pyridoxamine 5'-phosphate oxidase